VADVLVALKGAFEANGWHGPAVRQSVRGVTARQARVKPPGPHNSIHELVDHIEYWEAIGVHYVNKGAPPRRRRKDWAPPSLPWTKSLRRLRNTHRVLVAAVARLWDEDLDRTVRTAAAGRMRLARVLHGIAAHDAYHAGQIRLMLTLLRAR